jgi:hypothetical protein
MVQKVCQYGQCEDLAIMWEHVLVLKMCPCSFVKAQGIGYKPSQSLSMRFIVFVNNVLARYNVKVTLYK